MAACFNPVGIQKVIYLFLGGTVVLYQCILIALWVSFLNPSAQMC